MVKIRKTKYSDQRNVNHFLNKLPFISYDDTIRIWDTISKQKGMSYVALQNDEIVGILGLNEEDDGKKIVLHPFYAKHKEVFQNLSHFISRLYSKQLYLMTSVLVEDHVKLSFVQKSEWKKEDSLYKYEKENNSVDLPPLVSTQYFQRIPFHVANRYQTKELINNCFKGLLNARQLSEESVGELQKDHEIDTHNSFILMEPDQNYIGYIITLKSGEIESVGVLPAYRQRGVAKSMVYEVMKELPRNQVVSALILDSNQLSKSLFESFKFERSLYCYYYSRK